MKTNTKIIIEVTDGKVTSVHSTNELTYVVVSRNKGEKIKVGQKADSDSVQEIDLNDPLFYL